MRRNVASQNIGGVLTTVTSGTFFQPSSGLVRTYVSRDGGTLELSAVASGIARPTSYGVHVYTPAQSETDFDHLLFTFVVSGAVPTAINVYTKNGSLATQVGSLATQVGSGFVQVGSNFTSLGSLHTRVGSLSTLIGIPAGADLATDVKSIQTMVTSIYDRAGLIKTKTDALPSDPADASDVAASFTLLTNDLSSLHVRVSSVDNRVTLVGTNVDSLHTRTGSVDARVIAVGTNVDSLHTRVSSAATQIGSNAVSIGSLHTRVGALSTLIGTPVGATLAIDVKSIQTQVDSIYGRIGEAGINLTSVAVAGSALATVTDITSEGLARFFNRASGLFYSDSVSGSVVNEITKNAGGSGLTVSDIASGVWGASSASALRSQIDSLHTRVSSAATQVGSNAITLGSLHTRVSNLSALIGTPIGATLVVDVGSIQTQVNSIYARIGAPAGASIAADIAEVEGQTDDIGVAGAGLTAITNKTDNLPTDPADQSLIIAATDTILTRVGSVQVGVDSLSVIVGSIGVNVSSLHTRVGSVAVEAASGGISIGSLHTRVGSLSTLVGTNVGSVQTGVNSLVGLIAGGRMLSDVSAINSDVNAASNLRRGATAAVVGNTTGDSTTSVLSITNLDPAITVADQLLGRTLVFQRDTLTAALRGQGTRINSHPANGVLQVSSLTTAVPSGNIFTIN